MGIEKLKTEYTIDLLWRGFPLHPEVPGEGISTEALFANRSVDIENMRNRMKETAALVGLPLTRRGMVYNSRLAQELGFWAEAQNSGDAFHKAVFNAYFADGRNIGDIEVLVDVARSVGLPADDAQDVLTSRAYKPAVDLDWSLARSYNIHVVPTFVMNNHGLFGMQPYETLERFVISQGAAKR
ncbi:MAG: DsbA family protein [Deltaproteobacteria bacterium]|nr:DsbA family protein [Deltaproteobacteria bacterium]